MNLFCMCKVLIVLCASPQREVPSCADPHVCLARLKPPVPAQVCWVCRVAPRAPGLPWLPWLPAPSAKAVRLCAADASCLSSLCPAHSTIHASQASSVEARHFPFLSRQILKTTSFYRLLRTEQIFFTAVLHASLSLLQLSSFCWPCVLSSWAKLDR